MKLVLLLFVGSLLFSCAAPVPPSLSPSATPTPPAATPPPVVVEKIQLQAGSDPLAITELRVEPAQLALQTHEVAKIKILARLANGQTVEVLNHGKLNWQLADPSQLSLLNGTLKALQPGESEVVIRAGDQETRLKVKILVPSGGGSTLGATLNRPELVLPQPLYRLAVGENVYLQASLKQPDGSESKDVIFSVDKPALFELDSASGRLRRIKAGSATVTVQARLNGDVIKTIALEDKVIESSASPAATVSPITNATANPLATAMPLATPSPSPTSIPTPVPTPTPMPTPMPTPSATPTPLPTPTPTPQAEISATPTPSPIKSCGVLSYPTSITTGTTATFTATNSHTPQNFIRWTFQHTPAISIMQGTSPYTATMVWDVPGSYQVLIEAVRSNGMGAITCEGSPLTIHVTAPE